MSRFYALPMAYEVAKHPSIEEKDYLFGLIHTVVYKPTASKVESYSNYYKEDDARLFKNLIESPKGQVSNYVDPLNDVNTTDGASFRLDICVSHDGKFIALQLNHVADDVTTHITPIRYFEGTEAMAVDNLF